MVFQNWNKRLYTAIKENDHVAAKLAIQKGANVHDPDLMVMVAHRGNLLNLNLLLDAGANPAIAGIRGPLPFSIACGKGHIDIVTRLLDAGADPTADGDPSLCNACFNGHAKVVRVLLNAGAPTETFGSLGETPLTAACNYGFPEVVALLLAAGADIDFRHPDGQTVRQHAEQSGNPKCIALIADAERGIRPSPESMGILNRLGDNKESTAAIDMAVEQTEPEHQKLREAEIRERFKINPEKARAKGL